jgi:hypothetical protein
MSDARLGADTAPPFSLTPTIIAEFMLHLADRDARRRAPTQASGK